jgi:hypothetical protein
VIEDLVGQSEKCRRCPTLPIDTLDLGAMFDLALFDLGAMSILAL